MGKLRDLLTGWTTNTNTGRMGYSPIELKDEDKDCQPDRLCMRPLDKDMILMCNEHDIVFTLSDGTNIYGKGGVLELNNEKRYVIKWNSLTFVENFNGYWLSKKDAQWVGDSYMKMKKENKKFSFTDQPLPFQQMFFTTY